MLDFIKEVRILLVADALLSSYIDGRIYMASKPVRNTDGSFSYPQITMRIDDGTSDAQFGVCYPTFYVDIWCNRYGGWTESSLIGKRVVELLNGLHLTSGELEVYRVQKEMSSSVFDDDGNLWHRTIRLELVCQDYTEPQG